MRKLIFTEKSQADISEYTRRYREYYEELYRDSGIWAEEEIIDGYIRESLQREDEIYTVIENRMGGKYDIIESHSNIIWIRWRSKHIVSYEDDATDRIITQIEIR